MISRLTLAAGAIGGLIMGAAVMAFPAYWHGKSEEREAAKLAAAHEALERIKTMEKNNADFLDLPDRERCLVFMRDSGLPAEECDQR